MTTPITRADLERLGCWFLYDVFVVDKNNSIIAALLSDDFLVWETRVLAGTYKPKFRVKAVSV